MGIEKSYIGLAWFFNCWSIYVEGQFRAAQMQDSNIKKSKLLIVSPPTDSGIDLFARANANGETYLLCFSAADDKRCINQQIWLPDEVYDR